MYYNVQREAFTDTHANQAEMYWDTVDCMFLFHCHISNSSPTLLVAGVHRPSRPEPKNWPFEWDFTSTVTRICTMFEFIFNKGAVNKSCSSLWAWESKRPWLSCRVLWHVWTRQFSWRSYTNNNQCRYRLLQKNIDMSSSSDVILQDIWLSYSICEQEQYQIYGSPKVQTSDAFLILCVQDINLHTINILWEQVHICIVKA